MLPAGFYHGLIVAGEHRVAAVSQAVHVRVGDDVQPALGVELQTGRIDGLHVIGGHHEIQLPQHVPVQIQAALKIFDIDLGSGHQAEAVDRLWKSSHTIEMVTDCTVHHAGAVVRDPDGRQTQLCGAAGHLVQRAVGVLAHTRVGV